MITTAQCGQWAARSFISNPAKWSPRLFVQETLRADPYSYFLKSLMQDDTGIFAFLFRRDNGPRESTTFGRFGFSGTAATSPHYLCMDHGPCCGSHAIKFHRRRREHWNFIIRVQWLISAFLPGEDFNVAISQRPIYWLYWCKPARAKWHRKSHGSPICKRVWRLAIYEHSHKHSHEHSHCCNLCDLISIWAFWPWHTNWFPVRPDVWSLLMSHS